MPRSEYYQKNKEKIKAQVAAYVEAHREEKNAQNKRWRDANPEKCKAMYKAYYLKKKERKEKQNGVEE